MPEWISVKERLPDKTLPVLVATSNGDVWCTTFLQGTPSGVFPARFLCGDVTHWMPLPLHPDSVNE